MQPVHSYILMDIITVHLKLSASPSSLPKMQSILPYIAYLGSTFICLCCPQNCQTSKHSTCYASCVWVFFSVSFKCHLCWPDDPSLIYWNPPTLESVIVWWFWPLLPLLTDECLSLISLALSIFTSLCFLFSASSLHITQSIWFFVRDNHWLRSQPSACFSLSLLLIILFVWFSLCIPCFLFPPVAFVRPIVLSFFPGPCVPLTLSLTHFAHAHCWVNHTAGLSLNLSFLPTPVHVRRDHQRTGKLI